MLIDREGGGEQTVLKAHGGAAGAPSGCLKTVRLCFCQEYQPVGGSDASKREEVDI